MALTQVRVRASGGLVRNRWNATTRSTEGIGIMTVTARNVGIQGRLARDPQFFPKNGEKEAVKGYSVLVLHVRVFDRGLLVGTTIGAVAGGVRSLHAASRAPCARAVTVPSGSHLSDQASR
jgi:hypothetical protein